MNNIDSRKLGAMLRPMNAQTKQVKVVSLDWLIARRMPLPVRWSVS